VWIATIIVPCFKGMEGRKWQRAMRYEKEDAGVEMFADGSNEFA